MSATATIAITVGIAAAVLVGFLSITWAMWPILSMAKVGVRKDFEKKVKELQEWVDTDTKQRIIGCAKKIKKTASALNSPWKASLKRPLKT